MKVLVVEDDPKWIEDRYQPWLNQLNHQVISAQDGEEGLVCYQREPDIALVITDWLMTPMNGVEFVKRLRRTRERPIPAS